jgi:phospholipid/cholesterol/gamma-HCH transport system permease protein
MSAGSAEGPSPLWRRLPEAIGGSVRAGLGVLHSGVSYIGGLAGLLGSVFNRVGRTFAGHTPRIRMEALLSQAFRFGVRSIPIVCLVQIFIGVILALNIAPTFEAYGQIENVAIVIAIGVFRELGPLITAILLSGYAGASIAAEIGAMVEGEEIKALRAHALDPIRFLVAPRVIATAVMMFGLTVLADAMGVFGGMLTGMYILDISPQIYLDITRTSVDHTDYLTGLFKGVIFGGVIATLACYEGLNVQGGAEGVGRATTTTVVKSIVALIGTDMLFTSIFYVLGW